MAVARDRALTHLFLLRTLFSACVEMAVARDRALTHFPLATYIVFNISRNGSSPR